MKKKRSDLIIEGIWEKMQHDSWDQNEDGDIFSSVGDVCQFFIWTAHISFWLHISKGAADEDGEGAPGSVGSRVNG